MGLGLGYGMLRTMERVMTARVQPVAAPQLFILGLPRSGTTLVYQYIVHRLKVAYLTNGVGRFPYAPCLATWFQTRTHRRYRSDFASRFGRVSGAMAPREAGSFWGRFFHPDRYQALEEIPGGAADELRHTVARIQRIHGGKPFVNKNVKHMQRLGALAGIFDQSSFLVVRRPLADVALSLLRARYKVQDDPSAWWSVRPPDYESLRTLSPVRQVAGQVRSLAAQMDIDLGRLSKERVLHIDFDSFCTDPDLVVRLLQSAIGPLETSFPPVQGFDPSLRRAQTVEEEELLAMIQAGDRCSDE